MRVMRAQEPAEVDSGALVNVRRYEKKLWQWPLSSEASEGEICRW